MKSLRFSTVLLLLFCVNSMVVFGQISGITSGAVYTLQSKLNNKLLNVSNASIEDGSNVDCWTNTESDAQRWTVTHVGANDYTFTNVASGKLLQISDTPADLVNVNQSSHTGSNRAKWSLKKANQGSFYVRAAENPDFSLSVHANATADGTNVELAGSSAADGQKWILQKEEPEDAVSATAIADKVFSAWYAAYNMGSYEGHFWDNAEMIEIALDALEVTKDPKYKMMFDVMYKNFIEKNGADWQGNKYNDDIAWAVLFSIRGYLLTGNIAYRENAKEQFDKMWARAFSNTYGGGLLWYYTKTTKNSCINGPAMIACCYLAKATGDSTYYDKAIALYTWSKLYLFDAATGKLNDNVDLDTKTGQLKISTWSSTYNQGTYLGAATMLYNYTKEASYLSEAQKIAQYIRDNMYKMKVMDNEDNGNDLPGFKGIFARYARMYTLELQKTDLVEWLQLNAKVAYNNRNSQSLIHTKWATRTSETKPTSAFSCSTAVSLLVNTIPFSTIE